MLKYQLQYITGISLKSSNESLTARQIFSLISFFGEPKDIFTRLYKQILAVESFSSILSALITARHDLSPTTDQPSNFQTISFDCIFLSFSFRFISTASFAF